MTFISDIAISKLSPSTGKPTICIGKNKGGDQLCSNCEVEFRAFDFATRIVQFLYFLNPKFPASNCTDRFVSDLVVTQIVGFLMHSLDYNQDLDFVCTPIKLICKSLLARNINQ